MFGYSDEEIREYIIKDILSVINNKSFATIEIEDLIISFDNGKIQEAAVKYGYVVCLDHYLKFSCYRLTAKGIEAFSFLFI